MKKNKNLKNPANGEKRKYKLFLSFFYNFAGSMQFVLFALSGEICFDGDYYGDCFRERVREQYC
jgi:hypothetical protein